LSRSKGVTQKQFWKRFEAIERAAEVRAARFEDDTPEKQLWRMAEAVVLPERFNKHYLPHYFPTPPARFHAQIYRALEVETRTVVRAPRGFAKSTTGNFAYTLHQVVCAPVLKAWVQGTLKATNEPLYDAICSVMEHELETRWIQAEAALFLAPADPDLQAAAEAARAGRERGTIPLHWDPYIQLISVTEDTASEFTAAIKLELLDNALIRSDWGVQMSDAHQADGDWVSDSDVRVRAFGMRSAIRGGKHRQYRPTLAIFDDPDSEETVGTMRIRDAQTRKITAGVNFGLEPKVGRVIILGTPIHADCQVVRFTKDGAQFKRWRKLRFKAIQDDGTSLWPERWTVEALEAEREDDPEAFDMEMMDKPPSTGCPFTETHYYEVARFAREPLGKVLAFDPSLGKSETSDYQAVVILRGPTPEGWVLVHRIELWRIADPHELIASLHHVIEEEKPDLLVMETIGFQSLLEMASLDQAARDQLLIGWIRINTQSAAKDLRIRGTAPLWNNGTLRLPSDGRCRPLERQAGDYPNGKKDGLDVLEMALRNLRLTKRAPLRDRVLHAEGRGAAFRGAW
jgi:hypothetical protein